MRSYSIARIDIAEIIVGSSHDLPPFIVLEFFIVTLMYIFQLRLITEIL